MKRFVDNISGSDSKDMLLLKIQTCINNGAKIGKEIIVGFNSVNKLIESENCEVICIAKDTNPNILNCVIEVCTVRNIPFVILPNLSEPLTQLFKIKSVTCFALKRYHTIDNTIKIAKNSVTLNKEMQSIGDKALTQLTNPEETSLISIKQTTDSTTTNKEDSTDDTMQRIVIQANIDSLKEFILSLL